MDWNLDVLQERFAGKLFGCNFCYIPETQSTNDEAWKMGVAGTPEGSVVFADSQSRGRGRHQRSWHSPPGVNIYTSVVLRPKIEPDESSRIPIMAGVAVAEVLKTYSRLQVELKWPNDVLLNNKKICGILSQARLSEGKVDFIVLGIGINVNTEQFPDEICESATSLVIETGRKISRQDLLISLYENLEKWYKKLLQTGFEPVKQKWLELTPMIGHTVEVMFHGEKIEGKAQDLDSDGSLILVTEGNKKIKVSAGDATIIKR